jgi:hypothetical protein
MISAIWLVAGAVVGVLHTRLLWHGLTVPLAAFTRMGLVAGCLLFAALTGGLLFAAAGWFGGFAVSGLVWWMRAR